MPLILPPDVLAQFGIRSLRPTQQRAIDALSDGRDVLVVLPTGGGKSLCYQLPAVCGLAPAIVVSPLVALMKDQVDALHRRGVPAAQLSSAVTPTERERTWAGLVAGDVALVYIAPEALGVPKTVARLAALRPRYLAVDEAHCISEWGESFRPAYLTLGAVRRALGDPPTIALTATATPRTRRDIVDRLALRDPLTLLAGFDRPNLQLESEAVIDERQRLTRLTNGARAAPGPAVFYAPTRRETERLAATFRRSGLRAAAYHAGLPLSDRSRAQDAFLENRLAVIVATNAFGMGVDKPDVRLVMHAAPPLTLEAYYQEAGRGGRDGALARCVVLRSPSDLERSRQRLAKSSVTTANLQRLAHLLVPSQRLESDTVRSQTRLAWALGITEPSLATAVRLLVEEGLMVAAPRDTGQLRILVSDERLARDCSIACDDAAFVRRLLTTHGPLARSGLTLTYRQLAESAAGDAPERILARLAAQQVAVWTLPSFAWRVRRTPTPHEADALVRRHHIRTERNRWRFEQVANFVTTSRCRRAVLLRYFGDAQTTVSCRSCDNCLAPR